jgi:hypothetical protein
MVMSRYARFEHLRVDRPDETGVVELALDAPNLNAVGEGAHRRGRPAAFLSRRGSGGG